MNSTRSLSSIVMLIAAVVALAGCNKEGPVAPPSANAAGNNTGTGNSLPEANGNSTLPTENTSVKTPDNDASKSDEAPKSNVKRVKVAFVDAEGKPTAVMMVPRVEKTDEEWKKILTPEQYKILRHASTEAPFCGTLLDNKKEGVYFCAGCGLPLFSSNSKFTSGTGWPSFFQPFAKPNVAEKVDYTYGVRIEILCARCDGHLGHVFEDGPRPTGLRYCLNSESLTFTETKNLKPIAEKFKKEAEAAKE